MAVATLAQETCVLHPRLNSDLLITAAILHDVGKTREFELGAEIELSEAGATRGTPDPRPAAGGRALRRAWPTSPRTKRNALSHCILTHHGAEALPGRRFRSAEALALFRLNALDAGVKGALEHGL